MGCGCGGNKGIRGVSRRPAIAPRAARTVSAQSTPRPQPQVQAQAKPTKSSLPQDKRLIEKKRREDILKRLGRL